jgi:hypothetical protein
MRTRVQNATVGQIPASTTTTSSTLGGKALSATTATGYNKKRNRETKIAKSVHIVELFEVPYGTVCHARVSHKKS